MPLWAHVTVVEGVVVFGPYFYHRLVSVGNNTRVGWDLT